MQDTSDPLYSRALLFLDDAFARMGHAKLDIHNWSIDHLCYRVETYERYTELKTELLVSAKMLSESEVAGRPIATFKLHQPIHYGSRIIDLIELPAPKPGKDCTEGFEHLEVVMPISFQSLWSKYPDLRFNAAALAKGVNQDLKLSLGDIAIKFHNLSLESVINLENNRPVYDALQSSRILQILQKYEPLVAGTFPLGLQTKDSDIDVIAWAYNLSEPQGLLRHIYGDAENFHDERTIIQDQDTYIAKFMWNDIPFEIFIQTTPSVQSMAYRHFLIEERLLKTNGPALLQHVKNLQRDHGMKTEPAFAKALGLSGDPYIALLALENQPELT